MRFLKFVKILFLILILNTNLLSQTSPFFIYNNHCDHLLFSNVIDTINGTWSYVSPISEALLGVNSIYINETSHILIAGGTDTSVIPRNSCYWYNPSANSYSSAASLPLGRWSGKLVRVKNNLYLIGSVGNSFSSPDGLIFRYSVISNQWEIYDTMPAPRLHEAAVCVIKDSLIITIGGSTSGFSSPRNIVRIYNPMTRSWKTLTPYPISVTTAHAESHKLTDSTFVIVAFGGYSGGYVSLVYRGNLTIHRNDSISLSWTNLDNFPLSQGVYRVSGGKWNNYLLFGPSMRGSSAVNQIYGLKIIGDSLTGWTRFLPDEPESAANIPTFSVIQGTGNDSGYFYLFGGYRNSSAISTARRYAFKPVNPIGIINTTEIPEDFKLYQNYPNPFNPSTTINFGLPKASHVKLFVTDAVGREISVLVNEFKNAGVHTVNFDGSKFSSGIYFYSIIADEFRETRKMLLVK